MLFLVFLEGIITFVSPCMLPMLPVYLSYFAGGANERPASKTIVNSLGFVLGFTLVFVAMGAFAGTIGSFLQRYQSVLDFVTGLIVVLFGLNYLGVFRIRFFRGITKQISHGKTGFISSFVFGLIFSVGWTPCVGSFLGSALMMASRRGSTVVGVIMLLAYSLGLGIPFVICAILTDKLKLSFDFIKRHYGIINAVCGGMLVVVGILMMTGLMGRYLTLLS